MRSGPALRTVWVDPQTGLAGPSETAIASDIGAFREPCAYGRMAFDDPIVFPGKPGASHLHTFFGNMDVNANSTADSLATTGDSSCAGGTLNRSSYWVPSMIDPLNGRPLKPSGILVYYKTGYQIYPASAIRPLPLGLRMVTGSARNADPAGAQHTRYICYGPKGENPGWKTSITAAFADGTCVPGADFTMEVGFPQCWDGINLDSPNHNSHMADPEQYDAGTHWSWRCPSTHPVPLPVIAYNVHYPVSDAVEVGRWRLSSDAYDPNLPAGLSGHADYFLGWDDKTMQTWIKHCDQAQRDCHAFLLGDGTTLY